MLLHLLSLHPNAQPMHLHAHLGVLSGGADVARATPVEHQAQQRREQWPVPFADLHPSVAPRRRRPRRRRPAAAHVRVHGCGIGWVGAGRGFWRLGGRGQVGGGGVGGWMAEDGSGHWVWRLAGSDEKAAGGGSSGRRRGREAGGGLGIR